jgi:hypothetical protein
MTRTIPAFLTSLFVALIKVLAIDSTLWSFDGSHDNVFGKDSIYKFLPKTHPYQRQIPVPSSIQAEENALSAILVIIIISEYWGEFYGLHILRGVGHIVPQNHHSACGEVGSLPPLIYHDDQVNYHHRGDLQPSPTSSDHNPGIEKYIRSLQSIDAGIFPSNIFAWIRVTRAASTAPSPSEERSQHALVPSLLSWLGEGCIVLCRSSPGSVLSPDFSPNASKMKPRCPLSGLSLHPATIILIPIAGLAMQYRERMYKYVHQCTNMYIDHLDIF